MTSSPGHSSHGSTITAVPWYGVKRPAKAASPFAFWGCRHYHPGMFLTRDRRQTIAAIAGVALLLCQGMALAQACVMGSPAMDLGAASSPCHGEGDQQPSSSKGMPECQTASAAVADVPVFPISDFPALTVRAGQALAAVPVGALAFPLLRVEPPPHSLLHCCLRN